MDGSTTAKQTNQRRFRPKKGRPSAQQVTAINHVILTTAKEQFLVDGYAATSMDAIAAVAGVSKGTLYSRYQNKEALLRAVIEDRVTSWSAIASQQDGMAGKTIEERLKHHARTVMVWSTSEEVQAFDRLLGGAPEATRAQYEILFSNMIDFLTREIKEFSKAEGRPAKNPKRIATTLLATFSGWLHMERLVRRVTQREAIAFAHQAIDLLLAGRSGW